MLLTIDVKIFPDIFDSGVVIYIVAIVIAVDAVERSKGTHVVA